MYGPHQQFPLKCFAWGHFRRMSWLSQKKKGQMFPPGPWGFRVSQTPGACGPVVKNILITDVSLLSPVGLPVEAGGWRNRPERCWWQVKINIHTETEPSTPKLCVAVSGAEWRTWHSSIVAASLQYITADGRADTKPRPIGMSEWMGA